MRDDEPYTMEEAAHWHAVDCPQSLEYAAEVAAGRARAKPGCDCSGTRSCDGKRLRFTVAALHLARAELAAQRTPTPGVCPRCGGTKKDPEHFGDCGACASLNCTVLD